MINHCPWAGDLSINRAKLYKKSARGQTAVSKQVEPVNRKAENENLEYIRRLLSFRIRISAFAALYFMAAALAGCATLPPLERRTVSAAILDTGDTRLGKAIAPSVADHPGKSGIYPLGNARDAFAARVLLARAAQRTLDLQYYIWREDLSGTLLFNAVRDAADRGVRVRLLLDDHGTYGIDETLAALDAHPNIEVRLFNPFRIRTPRALNYAFDFFRLNRRMHNKSFNADNQAAIIGGRNIADEYFGATDGLIYADLDVLAVGPVVTDLSSDFDRYWASASSYPVSGLLPAVPAEQVAELAAAAAAIRENPAARAYIEALRDSPFVQQLMERRLQLEWAVTRIVSDDPAKGLGDAPPETLVPYKLERIIGEPRAEADLVAPYFVPGVEGTDELVALAQRGVKIRILSNSLEATDAVPAVHAFYAKRRKPLLKARIKLYELRRLTPVVEPRRGRRSSGSSPSSLHAKTFWVDGERVFVGSFHFDPRSAELNTELGFVIDSPALAQRFKAGFDKRLPISAYEVRLSEKGDLYWLEYQNDGWVRHDTEPGTTFFRRTQVWLLSLLPIEWLL
jgi:putative cardiolipin synthase